MEQRVQELVEKYNDVVKQFMDLKYRYDQELKTKNKRPIRMASMSSAVKFSLFIASLFLLGYCFSSYTLQMPYRTLRQIGPRNTDGLSSAEPTGRNVCRRVSLLILLSYAIFSLITLFLPNLLHFLILLAQSL